MFRYFKIGDHYRRTCPDGSADLCEHEGCRLPRRFDEDHNEIDHPCNCDLFDEDIVEDEDDSDVIEEDDDDLIDLGFAMREMSTSTDYGGVIE